MGDDFDQQRYSRVIKVCCLDLVLVFLNKEKLNAKLNSIAAYKKKTFLRLIKSPITPEGVHGTFHSRLKILFFIEYNPI